MACVLALLLVVGGVIASPVLRLGALSLHDALPISARTTGWARSRCCRTPPCGSRCCSRRSRSCSAHGTSRSEEHTSELQSPRNLVCRLLLAKKKRGPGQPPQRKRP